MHARLSAQVHGSSEATLTLLESPVKYPEMAAFLSISI